VVAILPTCSGLLNDFPYDYFRVVRLNREAGTAEFRAGIVVKLRPFFGFIGVAPPESMGRVSSNHPGFYGGNLDNRELTEGPILYLPVPGSLELYCQLVARVRSKEFSWIFPVPLTPVCC
jgi:acetamidase/formamidase